MASIEQIAANRRNAKKSTGPRTPEGTAAASRNALKHGLYAKTAVLPGEDQHELDQICDSLEADWQPQNDSERHLVEQMAASQWSELRVNTRRLQLLAQHLDFKDEFILLDRLDSQMARHQRSYSRALKDLRSLQKARLQAQKEASDKHASQSDYQPGLVWINRTTGERTIAVDPSVRGPDGEMHFFNPKEVFPDLYNDFDRLDNAQGNRP